MGEKKLTIATIGSAVQDVFLSNSDAFKPICLNPEECFQQLPLGSKVDVNAVTFSTGGGATNAAVTFARQGIDTLFLGVVGDDVAGHAVLNELDNEHVNTHHVRTSEVHNTGYSVLLLAPSGERTILTYRGASTHFDNTSFDLSVLDNQVDWLYVSTLSGQMDSLRNIFDHARANSIKIAFNPGKEELKQTEQLRSLLEDVEVLLVNKQEAQCIVEGQTLEELVRHAHNYCPVIIVSDGPNGVCATDGTTLVDAGVYEDVTVIDRTGAGDAFGSGFVSQWAQHHDLRQSLIFASANSTGVVAKIGAKAGILHSDSVLHHMALKDRPL